MEPIISFAGQHFFLSNFYPIRVQYEDQWYPSSEHAYVAAKTLDYDLRAKIAQIPSAGQVKKYGRRLKLREDWEQVKVIEMRKILESKFSSFRSDVPIRSWLDDTAPRQLIEGNTWGDTFWGQCPIGVGKNMLGELLMSIRDDITLKFGV